ncbi:hypothetical protein ['Camptotheca acuminata' phytoplasma]|uniref:hypothetical protein n=1 Tax='Camptotheca acuminata' phytoplasma TaxID=3239192 RepID=UPI003519F873
MINFLKKRILRKSFFSFIFNSAQGTPFREETYQINGEETKIEFFTLEQSKYNFDFLEMKQYIVWSFLDNHYRVFVYEPYYQKFEVLYQKEINIIYISFLEELFLKKRSETIKKNIIFSFLLFVFSLFYFLGSFRENFLFYLFFIIFFIIFFLFLNIKQKKNLEKNKKELFQKMIKKVKLFLGKKTFNDVSEKQKEYFYSLQIKKEE